MVTLGEHFGMKGPVLNGTVDIVKTEEDNIAIRCELNGTEIVAVVPVDKFAALAEKVVMDKEARAWVAVPRSYLKYIPQEAQDAIQNKTCEGY